MKAPTTEGEPTKEEEKYWLARIRRITKQIVKKDQRPGGQARRHDHRTGNGERKRWRHGE